MPESRAIDSEWGERAREIKENAIHRKLGYLRLTWSSIRDLAFPTLTFGIFDLGFLRRKHRKRDGGTNSEMKGRGKLKQRMKRLVFLFFVFL